MATRALEVVITGDTRKFSSSVKSADRDLDRFGKSGQKSLASLKTGMLAVGAAATAGVVVGLKKSAEAAIESEKANARLQAQLGALGIRYSEHEEQIQKVIDKHSQLSGFDDEDLGDSFTNIVRVVGDVNKALDLNTIAMDFARAKHMDVAKAGELVGKVAGGNTGILSRYGIQIEKGATATEALGLLQDKFRGQAKEYGDTTAGAVDRSQVAFENLGETVGAHVTPILARVAEGFTTLVRQITLGEGPGGRIRTVFEGIASTAASAANGLRGLVTGFQDGAGGARLLAGALGGLVAGFVAFKTITTVTAGVVALRAAWTGLTAAIAANPIGAIAIGIAAVVGALGVMSIKTRENEISSRDFTDALRAQADALRAVRDIDIDVAQRKANVKSATVAVEQAEKRLSDLRKQDGKPNALELKQAEADLSQAKVAQKRANRELARSEEDTIRKKEDAKGATEKLKDEERKLNSAITKQIGDRQDEIRGIDDSIEAVKQQGVQNDTTRKTVEKLRERQRALRNEINSLKSKEVDVSVKFKLSPAAGSSWGTSGDGIGRQVRKSVAKLAQTSGVGAFLGSSSGLDGADPDLAPFAAIGARYGLSVSSGLRPGAITSSGNPSFHGSGDAIDLLGPPGGMMSTFRFLKGAFGSRLRELIYTPGGVGIKDGKPHRYTGKVAEDHYDHVHVAYTGPFGDGEGDRKIITGAASSGGIDPSILYGVWGAESNFSHGPGPVSSAGATGPFQFMPATAKSLGVNAGNFRSAAYGAARYLGRYKGRGVSGMLAAYNAGPAGNPNNAETRAYIPRVLSFARQWGGGNSGGAPGASGGGRGAAGDARGEFRDSQKAGRGAARDAVGKAQERFVSPGGGYELGLAHASVGQARAEKRDDLSGMIGALSDERKIKQRRLRRITKLLKGRLGRKRRVVLLQEQAQLISEIGDLTETIKEYKADAKGGATTISRAEELDAGVDTSAGGSGSGGASDGGSSAADEAAGRLADELAGLRAEMKRQNDIYESVTGIGLREAWRALADTMSGQIVGVGLQGRRGTAGTGATVIIP